MGGKQHLDIQNMSFTEEGREESSDLSCYSDGRERFHYPGATEGGREDASTREASMTFSPHFHSANISKEADRIFPACQTSSLTFFHHLQNISCLMKRIISNSRGRLLEITSYHDNQLFCEKLSNVPQHSRKTNFSSSGKSNTQSSSLHFQSCPLLSTKMENTQLSHQLGARTYRGLSKAKKISRNVGASRTFLGHSWFLSVILIFLTTCATLAVGEFHVMVYGFSIYLPRC